MRKHQQRQILDILQTLYEAQAAGMFADCQDAAIGVGEFIEEIVGEGTQTVALLEEYCEMLYKASVGELERPEKQLRKQLISIENSVKNELKPDKIEMAFLPYNLSMWDSLESIYLAARDDPDCDAYVVPLPYYDFDGETKTLGEKMRYDGDKYPDNIPVVNWQAYDIEERRPDVIFIHYAYDDDGNNFSVPPEFYSKNLRQHCELLIYVPYYVLPKERMPQYFADLPGVLNSHYVIVQSEAVRQVYIDHFNKSAKEYGFGEKYGKAKDKFVALGSPKFDKVINTKREDCPLPPEWKKLITKPDGATKKIVLYNTHMFAWINNAEQYCIKIRSVFNIFKERGDDVVLWWRPHPGTELNFQKHKPEMLGEYYAVVREYQEGNVGIYDDTPDLHRAIAWSDVYYGDSSSLTALYEATGKPIMWQNVAINEHKEYLSDKYVFPTFLIDDGDNYWFTASFFSALFRMNKDTWIAKYMGSFSDEKTNGAPLYLGAAQNGGRLYFAPMQADAIAVYDIQSNEFINIPYDTAQRHDTKHSFYDAVTRGKYVYFTPNRYPAIMRLDTETMEIVYYSDWIAKLEAFLGGRDDFFFRRPCVIDGNRLTLLACTTNAVVEIDLDTMESTIHEVGDRGESYLSMCHDGEDYWLLTEDGERVVKWNPSVGVKNEHHILFEQWQAEKERWNKKDLWNSIIYCQGHIWLFPLFPARTVTINVSSGAVTEVDEISQDVSEGGGGIPNATYFQAHRAGAAVCAYEGGSGALVRYDGGECRRERISYTEKSQKQLKKLMARNIWGDVLGRSEESDCLFHESNADYLEDFITCISDDSKSQAAALRDRQQNRSRKLSQNADGSAGKAIYSSCKQALGVTL